jgi:penicillin-binding protein 2
MVENAGAVVVLNCKDSSILACATYPSYDISTYSENAAALNTAAGSPLWNRALLSTYATGSTMKPSVAIAALEEGAIDTEYTFYCNGSYNYLGQHFKCEQAHDSRYVDVVHAIDESCNTFFYEVGKMIGIEKMNEYRTLFGLGAKTGCELGEAAGVLDSPEYRASLNQKWLPGYTIQSAIGQAGNLFTPIQLANYCATIANGGTRYKTHFVKCIKSYDYSGTIIETKPEIVAETGVSAETLNTVKKGMLEVGTTGYCARYFAHLPVQVAAKTGTSQEIRKLDGVSVKINNGFLIAFAPYENPEIAIAVVGEGMTSGAFVAPVVADVVEYYYGRSDTLDSYQQENVLIP